MARKPRIEFKGAVHHVINRGNNRQQIFFDDSDYREFLNCIKTTQQKCPFILYCYILMPNHFHLLIESLDNPLSRIMRILLTRYAMSYNFKYKRVGHVFQSRYKAILCQKENYLLELVRYIHLNPVRANLVTDISKWRWSSHHAYLGKMDMVGLNTSEILSQFSKDTNASRKNYMKFVNEEGQKSKFNPYSKDELPYIGDEEFVETLDKKFRELRSQKIPEIRISLTDLASKICEIYDMEIRELQHSVRERKFSKLRSIFCYVANKMCFLKIKDIAKFLNISSPAVSKMIAHSSTNIDIQKIAGLINAKKKS